MIIRDHRGKVNVGGEGALECNLATGVCSWRIYPSCYFILQVSRGKIDTAVILSTTDVHPWEDAKQDVNLAGGFRTHAHF